MFRSPWYITNRAAAAVAVAAVVVVAAELAVVFAVVVATELVVVFAVVVVAIVVCAEQLVIESGMMAVTISILPIDNLWLNSVQTQVRDSQVSEKIEFESSYESSS
jgi:hypothetical protein